MKIEINEEEREFLHRMVSRSIAFVKMNATRPEVVLPDQITWLKDLEKANLLLEKLEKK